MTPPPADPRRVRSQRRGLAAETVAALALMLRGYRILARRERTPYGEIDLIARRGRRIAFVEVKYRPTTEEALIAVEAASQQRLTDAAEYWLARRTRYHEYDLGFDAILVMPWRLPVYLADVLQPVGTNVRADR